MLKTLLVVVAATLGLAACGSPCSNRNGSVDGYCDRTIAANCRSTCADCIDEWIIQACPGTCQQVDQQPAEGLLPEGSPNMSKPKKWAVCQ